ncbi:MAG: MarC family protein [Candidatus Methanofastidiosia archaeon]
MHAAIIEGAFALFVLMDPIGNIPIYLPLVKGFSDKERTHTVYVASLFSLFLLLLFLFGGNVIFSYLNIRLEHIMIAGGIVLALLGFDMMFGKDIKMHYGNDIAIVPLGMPLMSGPGSIATVLLLLTKNGSTATLLSIILAIVIQASIYLGANSIIRLAGKNGLGVMGNIAALIAVSFGIHIIILGISGIA